MINWQMLIFYEEMGFAKLRGFLKIMEIFNNYFFIKGIIESGNC